MQKEIEIAVEYWTQVLRERNPLHDNENGPGTHWYEDDVKYLEYLSEKDLNEFKQVLTDILTNQFERDQTYKEMDGTGFVRNGDCRHLSIDYEPRGALHLAYEQVFGDKQDDCEWQMCRRFPIKSSMWIDKGIVTVTRGWTGTRRILYNKKRKMYFKNAVFTMGKINCTTRRGTQWNSPGAFIEIYETGSKNKLYDGKIVSTVKKPFNEIIDEDIVCEHDPDCRTYDGLLNAMKIAYGDDFDENCIVTLVYFTIEDNLINDND
jgi:hypothetical protein